MITKWIGATLMVPALLLGCKNDPDFSVDKAIPIAEGTFIYKAKIYKLFNNELLQIGDLKNANIRKFEISAPKLKYLGVTSIAFIKKGASVTVSSVYRGNTLYFKLEFDDINDLTENYLPGSFTLEFEDEYGFMIYSVNILTSELIRSIGLGGLTENYQYNGKIELSIEAETAIQKCSMESTVRPK